MTEDAAPRIRLDKWLWQARFFKTRSLAAQLLRAGKLRLNGTHVKKASQPVTVEDVLTFPKANDIRVIKIIALGDRRGPASEAQTLYEDLAPPTTKPRNTDPSQPLDQAVRDKGAGRPTKAERRATDKLRDPF